MSTPPFEPFRGAKSGMPSKLPQLPRDVEQWSARALAEWLGVSVSTVKYHARQAFRDHNGRWELNREQAQRIVDRISCFGHADTLSHLKRVPLSGSSLRGSPKGSAFGSASISSTQVPGGSPPATRTLREKLYEDD